MAHLYCNGGNRFNYVSIRNYTQNNFGGGYSYGCSMPSFGGIFSNWGTGIYNGCACNGGFNWSTFWGTGCGSLVGSFLGMLCRPNNTSGSNQGQRAAGNNGNDTDYKKINDLADNMKKNETLISAKTICTLNNCKKEILQAVLHNYRERIKNLRENLDNKMDDENKRQLDALEAQIDELAEKFKIDSKKSPEIGLTNEQIEGEQEQPQSSANATSNSAQLGTKATTKDGSDTQINGSNNEDPSKTNSATQTHTQTPSLNIPENITFDKLEDGMIPDNLELPDGCTAPNAQDIYKAKIIKVEEYRGKTAPINVDTCNVSAAGNTTNGYPEYLQIKSTTRSTWYYKHAGKVGDYQVYITPNTDKHKNVYILCEQDGKFKLIQIKGFSGHGIEDTQNG